MIGEVYQKPLVVAGTVLFMARSKSGFVQRDREVYDQFGRRTRGAAESLRRATVLKHLKAA